MTPLAARLRVVLVAFLASLGAAAGLYWGGRDEGARFAAGVTLTLAALLADMARARISQQRRRDDDDA